MWHRIRIQFLYEYVSARPWQCPVMSSPPTAEHDSDMCGLEIWVIRCLDPGLLQGWPTCWRKQRPLGVLGSLAPPDLRVLSLLNEIYPNQRPTRGAGNNVCRFIVTDGLLKRVVTLLHVCSCSAYCAYCTWCFTCVCVCAHWIIESFTKWMLFAVGVFSSENDTCYWQDEVDHVELCVFVHMSQLTLLQVWRVLFLAPLPCTQCLFLLLQNIGKGGRVLLSSANIHIIIKQIFGNL